MAYARSSRLDRPVDIGRDHVLGAPTADITLVEYGSYACPYCHAAHDVIAKLRDRFGDRMRYVFRHLPIAGSEDAEPAAVLAEFASETSGKFWPVHDALMRRGPTFAPGDFERIAAAFAGDPCGRTPRAGGCRERAAQRRARDADLLHQ